MVISSAEGSVPSVKLWRTCKHSLANFGQHSIARNTILPCTYTPDNNSLHDADSVGA